MSRRLLNHNDLGASSSNLPVQNPFEIVKPKPVPVHTFVPSTPIFLSADEWNAICDKTRDATIPFKVEVTVIDNKDEEEDDKINVEEVVEEVYVPKRVRKSKK